jgi:hypothetical protein
MRTMNRITAAAALAPVIAALLAAQQPESRPAPRDDGQDRQEIRKDMAEKLKGAQELMTGLAIENYEMLADRANVLRRIGAGSLAKVSPSLEYLKYNAEFVAIAEQLERRARTRDLNGATLSYVRLTINCVECHKYVRDERILIPKGDTR